MDIGIDVSVLSVAKAGVWNYHCSLLAALLQVAPPGHRFVLLDYPAIHGRGRVAAEVQALPGDRTQILSLSGFRHRKLSRIPALEGSSFYPISRRIDQLLERPWGWAADFVLTRQIASQLAGLDVFHVSDVLNCTAPGVKSVTTIHDLTTILYPEYHTDENIMLLDKKYRFAREKADQVIAISESTKRDIVEHLRIDPRRIQVVYYGCDPRFRPLDSEFVARKLQRWNLIADSYLLYVGTIEPRKNLLRLLRAYAQIRADLPAPRPKLVLAGAIGWKAHEFLAEVRRLDLAEEVQLLGTVCAEGLPPLYNGARALVYPSLYEGFGFPPLEAMASGTPVVTSNVSSLPEVVGDAAVLVDPLDTHGLAEAIFSVATDPGYRKLLRLAGLERAQQFTWEKAALETLEVYRKAANG